MTRLGQKWAYLSTNHMQNAKRRAGSCGKSSCRMFIAIVYGCHLRSNFVILLHVVFESPVGLRLALFVDHVEVLHVATVLMLFTDLVVRHLPDFSVFQFWLIRYVEYFAKFLKMILVHGGCRFGNLSSKRSNTRSGLPVELKHHKRALLGCELHYCTPTMLC